MFKVAKIFLLTFLLSTLVSAVPARNIRPTSFPLKKRSSYRIDRVRGRPVNRSAARAARKAFKKFGMTMPEGLANGAGVEPSKAVAGQTADETGEVANAPQGNDVEFLAPIKVGGQEMVMDFDTGSSDLWLFSTLLSEKAQAGHTPFNPQKSATFEEIPGAEFNVSFGDGSAAAGNVVGLDTVDIGGATATRQAVELATDVSDSFVQDTASNGLVGLAFSKLNTVKPEQQKTFFDTIKDDLALPVLAANLKHASPGFYEFGKIDTTSFSGNLSAAPVDNSNGFWQIESNSFQIGDDTPQKNPTASPAIADTGTTLMLVDDAVAEAYYSSVQGAEFNQQQGLFQFPCDSDLQDFKVALGPSYMATIDKSLLNFEQVDAQTCSGAIQPNQGSGLQIYGDILFKSQFAVFNIDDNTVSFAPHAQ